MTVPASNTTYGGGQQPMLGRYALVREIARSNDIVWEGRDTQMNRRVAVKELSLTASVTGQARRDRIERFYREARAAGAMSHPNIVTIHEVGEDRGRYFIAMEYLEGQTLRERLAVAGALPLTEAVGIMTALCDALEYAHERGVIHRDIKPDNIHLLPGGRVKLTDFGIARILHETQLTVAGQVFGTPSYMSPEQVLGKAIDARSDIFSLGILLYELVTGRKPFTGDSVITITYRIINEPIPSVVGTTPAIEAVIQRATAKSPSDRFNSVSDLRAALLSAASGATAYGSTVAPPLSGYTAASTAAPQMTAQYGTQTRLGVAPGYAAAPPATAYTPPPLPTAVPPPATYYPSQPSGGAGKTFGTVAVSLLIVGGVALGGGWALSKAYKNHQVQAGYAQDGSAYNDAAQLYQSGDYEKAAAAFRKIREANRHGVTVQKATEGELFAYRQLGHQAQARNDLTTAEKWYAAAVAVAPGDAQAQEELKAVQGIRNSNTPALPAPADTTPQRTSEWPKRPSAGTPNLSASDFNNANNAAATEGARLLAQGDEAARRGNMEQAVDFWTKAVQAGTGSAAATQAQQRITDYASKINPFN